MLLLRDILNTAWPHVTHEDKLGGIFWADSTFWTVFSGGRLKLVD